MSNVRLTKLMMAVLIIEDPLTAVFAVMTPCEVCGQHLFDGHDWIEFDKDDTAEAVVINCSNAEVKKDA